MPEPGTTTSFSFRPKCEARSGATCISTRSGLRQLLRSRFLHATLLAVLTIAFLGASESRFDRLGGQMVCMCGCNQILNQCNHVGCPVSPVMLNELQAQLATGISDTAVLNWFAAKYGAIVLAAPIRGGFDNVAWITPLAVFVLATAGTAFTVWAWRRRSLRFAPANPEPYPDPFSASNLSPDVQGFPAGLPDLAKAQALRDRIREETEYR